MTTGTDLDALLPAIAAGDADAFARWLAGAEPVVRGSLRAFAARVDVEAVLQETLLRVWQVAPRVAPDGKPNGLLRVALRAARNLAIDEARRGGRFVESEDPEPAAADAPAPAPPDPFLRAQIALCWDKLPEQPRVALGLRLEDAGGLDDRRLADDCGMKLNTFLQNVGRARKHLLACLEAQGVEVVIHPGSGGAP